MKVTSLSPARRFAPAPGSAVEIRHVADIELDADEQVTFRLSGGAEWDVVRKSFGFYVTPSLDKRLARFGLRVALCRNQAGNAYLVMVEADRDREFSDYCRAEGLAVVQWLPDGSAVP